MNEGEGAVKAVDRPELIAYRPQGAPFMKIERGERWRTWINEMRARWANRCLPLIIANEAGWMLLNSHAFEAVWEGGADPASIQIAFDSDVPNPAPVQSHFGDGILTWAVPFLFRTPRGYNLLARGPSNDPKDGIGALEGLVETDWSVATFTMNWRFTRPNHPVRFEQDEPFCMIVPQRRGELELFQPVVRALETNAETLAATKAWVERRHESQVRKFLATYSRELESEKLAWERDYFKGTSPDGTRGEEHQTHLHLEEFVRED